MERSDEARLAVLIDADNTSAKWGDATLQAIWSRTLSIQHEIEGTQTLR